MKKYIFLLLAALVSQITFSQTFEGRILYQLEYQSNNPDISDEQWTQMMGSRQEYFIKGEYYKSITNGAMAAWQLFIPDENRLYTKMINPDVALWNDAMENPDSVLSFEINKDALSILGYQCDELILNCTSGIQKYYFTSKLPVDPADYVNHKYGNWAYFISKSKSLALKIIIESEYFVSTTTALEISEETLDPKIFVMDPNIPTQKNPY